MADNIEYIHANKLAKYNYPYIGKDGTVYIGQKDGRLAKKRFTAADIPKVISSQSAENFLSTSTPTTSTIEILNPFLLMGG